AAGAWWGAGHPIPGFLAHHFKVASRGDTKRAREEPRLAVRTVRASAQEVPVAFEYTGTIISPRDAELQTRVTGFVVERPFEPGGHVK
ncbi:hypothetical protein ABTL55_19475, partial [Acinetobacter baumannii]